MSFAARLLLAAFALLFGATMILIASDVEHRWAFRSFGAFCLCIALACFTRGRLGDLFGSLVASGIVIAGIAYLVAEISSGSAFSGNRAEPSVVNALLFNLVFSLPAAVYLWRARFGLARRPALPGLHDDWHDSTRNDPAGMGRRPQRPD